MNQIISLNKNNNLTESLLELINKNLTKIFPYQQYTQEKIEKIIYQNSFHHEVFGTDYQITPDILCAVDESGSVAAAVKFFSMNDTQQKGRISHQCYINWFFTDEENEMSKHAADELIKCLINLCRTNKVDKILTFLYLFGFGWGGFSDKLTLSHQTLLNNNFQINNTYHIYTKSLDKNQNNLNLSIKYEISENQESGETEITLYDENKIKAGTCILCNIPEFFGEDEKEWKIIDWICIENDFREKGFGRILLNIAEAYAQKQEYKNIVLWAENHAEGFYAKCGYQKHDTTHCHMHDIPSTS